jgi:hypothetical protein
VRERLPRPFFSILLTVSSWAALTNDVRFCEPYFHVTVQKILVFLPH